MNNKKKCYTIFAGVNGAGKSTLYEDIKTDDFGERINPDEIAKELGDFNDPKIQIKSGRIAVERIKSCIDNEKSFNQETTLAGKSVINQVRKLKDKGYSINLFYVGLTSKELAVERVKYRVANGGHNIDEKIINERYDKSLQNLSDVLMFCDNVMIFDNSRESKVRLLKIEEGRIKKLSKTLPDWADEIINDYCDELINQRVISHKKWLQSEGKDGEQLVLESENLNGFKFFECDLRNSEIKNCDLSNCVFYADMSGATFQGNKIINTKWTGTIIDDIKTDNITKLSIKSFIDNDVNHNILAQNLKNKIKHVNNKNMER